MLNNRATSCYDMAHGGHRYGQQLNVYYIKRTSMNCYASAAVVPGTAKKAIGTFKAEAPQAHRLALENRTPNFRKHIDSSKECT